MDLLKTITNSGNTEDLLGTYLKSSQEQLSFINLDASLEKSLISSINSKLNEPSTRFVGLSVLHIFLKNCPQNTVNENAISWLSLCLKGTVSPVASTCNLAYQVLSSLFNRCSDQAKHVASAVLPKLLEHFQSVPKHCIPAALGCLEACMKVYNGSCGPHKNSIQKFLIPLLEYNGPNKAAVVWKASVCVALVPQLGGGGVGGVTYQENWTKQLKMACSTLHEILDQLFSSVHELEVHNVEVSRDETFPFESLEDKDTVAKAYALLTRFEGVVSCIQAMLLGEFRVLKNLPPSAVLSVVCRGLAVSSVSLQSTSTTESLTLLTLLPNVQTKLLGLLKALISCCGANLLPFGRLVIKLVLQTLKWTMVENWKHKTTKPYRSLRTAAYECIKYWLDCVRTVPSCDEFAELVEICCGDFQSGDDGVRLIAGKSKNKYGNRKEAKKRASKASTVEDDSAPSDPTANKEVCVASLQVVQSLLAVHGWALNGGSYNMLHETTLKLVLSVSCQPQSPVVPYSEPEARVELYRLLWALVSHPHPQVASPIKMAWKLFSLGQNDPILQVSSFCFEALSNTEKIVQPSFASLALPIPDTEDVKSVGKTSRLDQIAKTIDSKSVEKKSSGKEKETKRQDSSSSEETEINIEKEPKETEENKKGDEDKLSNGVDQEMIDVSDEAESGSNGDDIEEVPVEIDLADSENEEQSLNQDSGEVTEGIEIIDDKSSAEDDFKLAVSPDPSSANGDKRSKRRAESLSEETEKSVVSSSRSINGNDKPPPPKVFVVAEDDAESDVDTMLASFVDKVKPIYEDV